MESSCEQILKWTEKVLNGGAITEEEARTLIRTAGGMNGVMIGNYLTSKCSDPQDDAMRDKAATFTPSACFWRDHARVKETLIKSQSRISHGFLYIASSSSSLNSSLFASDDSSLCIKIQE